MKNRAHERNMRGLSLGKHALRRQFFEAASARLGAIKKLSDELSCPKLLRPINQPKYPEKVNLSLDIQYIFEKINKAGPEIYLVGSEAINRILLTRQKHAVVGRDYDFVIFNADRRELISALNENYKGFKQSKHIKILYSNTFNNKLVEVFTPSRDEYKPDITIAGLSVDSLGTIHDYSGKGPRRFIRT